MNPSPDELAGVVDLFGGLTRTELRQAFEDLAAKQGGDIDMEQYAQTIKTSVEDYYLVEIEQDDTEFLVTGPAALPSLPPYGEDLPHILSIDKRPIDQETRNRTVEARIRKEAAQVINKENHHRVPILLDICYEVESWAGLETTAIREQLSKIQDPQTN